MLVHSLIVQTPRGADSEQVKQRYTTKTDTVIEIQEHKKEKGTAIGIFIEDIRELQHTVRTARAGSRTIVIFSDASSMTHQAQNALLKLLEEPRGGLYLILQTSSPQLLLPTIRSRCHLHQLEPQDQIMLPADTKAKIEFMAAGDRDEQRKLASDLSYYTKTEQWFALAKNFVGGSIEQKLTAVKEVKDSRSDALGMLQASIRKPSR